MKTSRFAMMSIIALVITVSACETPNNPSNTDAPNPPGTGWVQFDTTRYKGLLANFTILRNVISFDINAVVRCALPGYRHFDVSSVRQFGKLTDHKFTDHKLSNRSSTPGEYRCTNYCSNWY